MLTWGRRSPRSHPHLRSFCAASPSRQIFRVSSPITRGGAAQLPSCGGDIPEFCTQWFGRTQQPEIVFYSPTLSTLAASMGCLMMALTILTARICCERYFHCLGCQNSSAGCAGLRETLYCGTIAPFSTSAYCPSGSLPRRAIRSQNCVVSELYCQLAVFCVATHTALICCSAVADYGQSLDGGTPPRLMEHAATLGDVPFFRRDDGTVTQSRFVARGSL